MRLGPEEPSSTGPPVKATDRGGPLSSTLPGGPYRQPCQKGPVTVRRRRSQAGARGRGTVLLDEDDRSDPERGPALTEARRGLVSVYRL